jgi:transposase InsO family protein
MALNVYSWEYIHKYFPPEVVEQYRKQIIAEWLSGKFKDKEIWERYGMSENTFYGLIKRYSTEKEEGLKDKPSTPKNPSHKLGQDEIQIIINKAREERERINAHQSEFESDMKKDGRSLSPKKKEPKHLKRPEEPLRSFMMDFTQKRIGNGETEYILGILDMHNDAFVILTDHHEKSGDNVKKDLQSLKEILPPDQKIEIRSDGGTEFDNKTVDEFCSESSIDLNIVPKGYPWLQAFIERGFRTIKEEFLNLVWIGSSDKFRDVLKNAKCGYNNRPNSAFGYLNPLELV